MDEDATPTSEPELDSSADSAALISAMMEIEKASAALRQAVPALEPWRPNDQPSDSQIRNERHISVWILVGTIWAFLIVILSSVSAAILYTFG